MDSIVYNENINTKDLNKQANIIQGKAIKKLWIL